MTGYITVKRVFPDRDFWPESAGTICGLIGTTNADWNLEHEPGELMLIDATAVPCGSGQLRVDFTFGAAPAIISRGDRRMSFEPLRLGHMVGLRLTNPDA